MRSEEFNFQGPSINIWVAGLCPLLLVITKQVDHDGDVGDHGDHDGDAGNADEDEAFVCLNIRNVDHGLP